MVDSLTFGLPDTAQPVRPVLKITQDIHNKDYILTVIFEGPIATMRREDVPQGLLWSTSLECPFVYLPDAQASTNLYLSEFLPPIGAQTATLSVAPWASTAPGQSSPFSEMVLETSIVDRPAVIIGKEG